MNQVATTLICLFHNRDDAESMREDLVHADVPEHSITLIHRDGSHPDAISSLSDLDLPSRDLHRLLNGLEHGDTLLTVDSDSHLVNKVEAIFRAHEADPVSESDPEKTVLTSSVLQRQPAGAALTPERAPARMAFDPADAQDEASVLPVLREEPEAGKRTGDTGRVRVFHHVVEIPFNQEGKLRDLNIRAVDRRVAFPTASPVAIQEGSTTAGEEVIELTETREELVITKAARVIEEVIIGRETTDRIQHVEDTLRHTEIEVRQVSPGADPGRMEGAELVSDGSPSRSL